MKHSNRSFAAPAAFLLALVCLLSACSGSPKKLTETNGVYRSKSGDMAFVRAPDSYYAVRLGDVQAIITADGADSISLYTVVGGPDGLLADQSLYVYSPEGAELPTLKNLGATQVSLYQYTDNRIAHHPVSALKDAEKVNDLVRLATGSETIPAREVRQDYELRCEVLFLADGSAGIGIMLEYREFPSDVNGYGTNFLYDTDALCYIPVGDTMDRYFFGEETE